ncbi:hypothetical protein Ciccas_014120 [Cichlidogyrus casuarinus]|uniref:Uncharacterized protein n=1 Tax=Cichlidogyrus casuarinus TaxID=1844966 RepID=A0ABD2PIW1_9PLAT
MQVPSPASVASTVAKKDSTERKLRDSGIFDEELNDQELVEAESLQQVKRRPKKNQQSKEDQRILRESITPDKLKQFIKELESDNADFPFIDEKGLSPGECEVLQQVLTDGQLTVRTATMTELNDQFMDGHSRKPNSKLALLCCTSKKQNKASAAKKSTK